MQLWPENSPLALREAVRLGAQMIEFDLRLSKDGEPMVIHDQTVDRMTNGTGRISEMTVRELKQLTYRSDGEPLPDSERILTLREALELFPRNIWLNLHLKGKVERTGWQIRLTRFLRSTRKKTALAGIVTRQIIDCGRRHQALLTCGGIHAMAAREENESIQICYVVRGRDSHQAVQEAIAMRAQFIQLSEKCPPTPDLVAQLKQHGLRISYCFGESPEEARKLFSLGVNFPLANNIHELMPHAAALGLKPVS